MLKNKKRRMFLLSSGTLFVILVIVGISYALWTIIHTQTGSNVVENGCLETTFTEINNGINLINTMPITDEEGTELVPYTFKIKNICKTYAKYQVNLEVLNSSTLLPDYVKAVLNDYSPKVLSDYNKAQNTQVNTDDSYELIVGGLFQNQEVTFNLRIWMDYQTNVAQGSGKSFSSKIVVVATVGKEPDVIVDYDENMIAISYNEAGETVKADKSNSGIYKWYDYCQSTKSSDYNYKETGCEFRWANIVLVNDTSREKYKRALPGVIINEDDILAYLVYIPRYRYELFNMVNPQNISARIINITFENKNTAKSNGNTNGSWLTHPAFTFGDTELNGIWVGKFESSAYTGDSLSATCIENVTTANCDNPNIIPVIKPNVRALGWQILSTQYLTAQKFKSNVMYGISSSSIDSHMMKNMEWGAVAILSQSRYGKQGNPNYTGVLKEVAINNSSGYITGRSSGYPGGNTGEPTHAVFFGEGTSSQKYGAAGYYAWDDRKVICTGICDKYNVTLSNYSLGAKEAGKGVAASTTGTQYGIYDMSGGTYEAVMGNMAVEGENVPGPINSGSSGFNGTTIPYPEKKYYDSYLYGTSSTDYTRSQLGDATGQTRNWYSDNAAFLINNYPWFLRGSNYSGGATSGVFQFTFNSGYGNTSYTWRGVLVFE